MIDIHSHTNYSDGSFTVKELLEKANKINLVVLSITDHNTIDAYLELNDFNIRKLFKGNIIAGVELTTTYKGEVIEILGYCFDLDIMKDLITSTYYTFSDKQKREYNLIRDKFINIGIKFNENNIKFNPNIESSRNAFWKEIIKYPENYKYFYNKDSLTNKTNFTRYEIYNPKSKLYVNEEILFPSLEKVIELVHKANGLTFLAHTFEYSSNIKNELDNIINNYNLDGLECFYTTFNEEQTNFLVNTCKRKHLYMSGGSDFHGFRKTNHELGNLNIDNKIIKSWIKNYL